MNTLPNEHLACLIGRSLGEIVRLSGLMSRCYFGQLEACRLLLDAGAAVAARDHARRCPLHYGGSSAAVTQLLLDFGADPDAKVRTMTGELLVRVGRDLSGTGYGPSSSDILA